MRKITELRERLIRLNYAQFIGVQVVLGLIALAIQFAIILLWGISIPTDRFENGYTFIGLQARLIPSALIETLLFQYLPFIIFSRWVKNSASRKILKPTRYILFSSVVFGLFHIIGTHWLMPLVVIRVLFTALCGMVLAVSFYILRRKKQMPILSVTLIHFLINFILISVGAVLDLIMTI